MTTEQVAQARLYYAALDVIREGTIHDATGQLVVLVPHRVWTRLEAIIDALPHPAATGAPATPPDGR